MLKIRFLYFEGCPNKTPALERLKAVLNRLEIDSPIEMIEIKTVDDAQKYHFLGSPSIQINGVDIEKERINDPPFFGCRLYQTPAGPSGIPPEELLIQALRNALS